MGKRKRRGAPLEPEPEPALWSSLPTLLFKVPATMRAAVMRRLAPGEQPSEPAPHSEPSPHSEQPSEPVLPNERRSSLEEVRVAAANSDARAAARGVRSKLGAPLRQDAMSFIMYVHGSEGSFEPQAVHLSAALFDEVAEPGEDTDVAALACCSLAAKFHLPLDSTQGMDKLVEYITGVDEDFMHRAEWEAMGRLGCDVHIPTAADVLVDCACIYSARVGAAGDAVRFGAHFLADCCLFADSRVHSFPPSRLAVACLLQAAAGLCAPEPHAAERLGLSDADVATAAKFVRRSVSAVCREAGEGGEGCHAPARTVYRQYTAQRFRCRDALQRPERAVAKEAVQRLYERFKREP